MNEQNDANNIDISGEYSLTIMLLNIPLQIRNNQNSEYVNIFKNWILFIVISKIFTFDLYR
jgi:hypothetical protein